MLKLFHPLQKRPSDARRFLDHADNLVDRIVDPKIRRTIPPPRFLRDSNVFLTPVRFGRTRLFLSKFIGRAAWRGWVSL